MNNNRRYLFNEPTMIDYHPNNINFYLLKHRIIKQQQQFFNIDNSNIFTFTRNKNNIINELDEKFNNYIAIISIIIEIIILIILIKIIKIKIVIIKIIED